ncbi:putative DCD domain-containing protein NRP [Helianthus annuus]|nr:putative DCD domain-containing protein NRP [Helianthus annuus]
MGRKQKKKINTDSLMKEASVFSNYSAPARNLRKTDLGAVIFGATHNTINECLSRQLFGLPEGHYSYIKNIKEGLVLFLFNYSDRKLHGIFEAAGHGQMNIDQYAWVDDGGDGTGYTRYPAQVKIRARKLCNPLSEDQFHPIIAHNYYESNHFYFELDHDQTDKLVSLFTSSAKGGISKKWNTLYASLPKASERQEYSVHVSQGMTDLRQRLPENLYETSKVSYASALCRTGNTTTNASSSQPVGEWRALFKSDHDADTWEESHWAAADEVDRDQTWASDFIPQANTATNKVDVMVGNTWEESHWAATDEVRCDQTWTSDVNPEASTAVNTLEESHWVATNEAECDHTWESDLNHEANTGTNKADVVLGNTWEESQHIAATCAVQHGQTDNILVPKGVETDSDLQSLVAKLMQEFEAMKGSQVKQIVKINRLEQELETSKLEIQQLKNQVRILESGSRSIVDPVEADNQLSSKFLTRFTDSVFIVGGHDGSSWLPALDSYFPSHDIKISLTPMNFIKSYASAATLNGEIYHFGGDGSHTVESFNPTNNLWIPRPPLYWKNINAAGASINDKLFVVGGAKESHYSSEVEYLDLNIGKWLPARSMQSKRLAPAAAELNNVLYVSGGYDGVSYTSSVERFDPREEFWCKVPNMNARKGCHSMVVLNEKLYTVGGFGGDRDLATVEYLDTRMGAWVEAEPMNVSRGNFATFVFGGMMYTIGGRKENVEVLDIVECYKEGGCWEVAANLKAIGKRSHFSAFVM